MHKWSFQSNWLLICVMSLESLYLLQRYLQGIEFVGLHTCCSLLSGLSLIVYMKLDLVGWYGVGWSHYHFVGGLNLMLAIRLKNLGKETSINGLGNVAVWKAHALEQIWNRMWNEVKDTYLTRKWVLEVLI